MNSGNLKTYGDLDTQQGGLSKVCSLVHAISYKVCLLIHINRLSASAKESIHTQKRQLKVCARSLHKSAGSAHPASLEVTL